MIVTDGAFVDTFELSLIVGSYHYLIWNPDPTPTPGMTMHTVLTALGYNGNYSTTLSTENLEMYRAIFVCVGIYPSNYVITDGSPEATALVNYVNAGGNMYLEGGDVWYYDPLGSGYSFGPMFGILPRADGSADLSTVAGLPGTFTEGMSFSYTGQNSYIDHLSTTGTGFTVLKNPSTYDTIGVANDAGTYRTVGTSFELGGLVDGSGVSTKAVLLDSIMHFFGIDLTGIEGGIANLEVDTPSLQLAPNPFCNSTTIRFSATSGQSSTQDAKLSIYNAAGRAVRSFQLPTSYLLNSYSVVWDGTDQTGHKLPTGIYFVQLDSGSYTETQKIILVE
jgi:hypothetical protein